MSSLYYLSHIRRLLPIFQLTVVGGYGRVVKDGFHVTDENGVFYMALYVDSAYLPDIIEVERIVPLAGATTNPTILLTARERGQDLSPQGVLSELLRSMGGIIFMQPGATEEEEMYTQALAYIQASPNRVIPKIPMNSTGMRVARRLKHEQRRIAFT